MVHVRHLLSLCLLFVFVVPLAACGGGKPVAFADIPVYPDATLLEPGSNAMADAIRDSFRQSQQKVDMQMYTLPAEATWEEVQSFYTEQIKGDWKVATELAQDSEAFNTIGWTRGSGASEQSLAVGYGPAMLGSAPYLMVAMFSE